LAAKDNGLTGRSENIRHSGKKSRERWRALSADEEIRKGNEFVRDDIDSSIARG